MSMRKEKRARVSTHIVEAHNTHTVFLSKTVMLEASDEPPDLRPDLSGGERAI
jgi:hypothetical protein